MADWATIIGTAATGVFGGGGIAALWLKGKTSRQERFENNILAQLDDFREENNKLRDEIFTATQAATRADARTDLLLAEFVKLLGRYKRVRQEYRKLLHQTNPGTTLEEDTFEVMDVPEGKDLWSMLAEDSNAAHTPE